MLVISGSVTVWVEWCEFSTGVKLRCFGITSGIARRQFQERNGSKDQNNLDGNTSLAKTDKYLMSTSTDNMDEWWPGAKHTETDTNSDGIICIHMQRRFHRWHRLHSESWGYEVLLKGFSHRRGTSKPNYFQCATHSCAEPSWHGSGLD